MDRNNKFKAMNFILVISFLMSTTGCHNHPEPETYLIPKGFTGRATVVFNQKNGVPKKYENGRRVYEIPVNGICLTQFNDEYGIVNHQYYYVDNVGNRIAIPLYKEDHNPDGTTTPILKDKNEVGIFLDGSTGQYDEPQVAPFQMFVVSSYNAMDSFFTPSYKKQFENFLIKATGLEKISIP